MLQRLTSENLKRSQKRRKINTDLDMEGFYDYKILPFKFGQVAEWFKAAVLKIAVGASLPWVRIPPCPPFLFLNM